MSSSQGPGPAVEGVLPANPADARVEVAATEQAAPAGAATKRAAPARRALARALPALRALGFLAALAIVVVVTARAARDVELSELALWPLPLAFAATLAWWLLLGRGWALLSTGHVRRGDISTWCKTQSLRYLPGGIWAPASRVAIVRGSLLDRLSTVAAENLIALCAALALGGLALGLSGDLAWLPLVLVIGAPAIAARFLAARTRVGPERTLQATGNYLVAFVAYSLAAVLVQTAVSGAHEPLAVAGAAALAWGAGLVVVIAPGGVGVREVVYVALLSHALPTSELAAAAVAFRVVAVIAELIVLLAAARPAPRTGATRAREGR